MLSRWPTCGSWSQRPWRWRTRNNRSSRESWRRMTRTLWDNSPTLCISSSVYVSVCFSWCRMWLRCAGWGSGSGFPHHGEVRFRERWNHASHWHHERRRSDHDRAWQHHAGVWPGHHGHQQRWWWWWWWWGRSRLDEEWVFVSFFSH